MLKFMGVLERIAQCKLMDWGIGTAYPYYLVYAVTNRCNSRCTMCAIWKQYVEHPERAQDELTIDEIDRMLYDIPEPIWFSLTGGEVFLRNDIVDVCKVIHEHYPNLYGLGMPSNGLLTEHILDSTARILDIGFKSFRVSISVDGTREINDRVRGVEGGLQRAMSTFGELKQISRERPDFKVGLNWTITPLNAGDLERFLDSRPEIDANDLALSVAQTGHAFFNQDYDFLRMDKAAARRDIDCLLRRSEFPTLYGRIKRVFVRRCKDYLNAPDKMILPCSAGIASCFIDPYGDVYPCTVWHQKMGSLRDAPFGRIWTSRQANELRKSIREERCPICWSGCESTHQVLQNLHRIMGDLI